MSEQIQQRSLPRAEWQRTVGAVFLNTLIGDAFDYPVPFSASEYRQIDMVARERADGSHGEIDLYMGSVMYDLAERTIEKAYERTHERNTLLQVAALNTGSNLLRYDLQEYTFYRVPQRIMPEALESLARFPINLIHHISHAAHAQGIVSPRFDMQNLDTASTLLKSRDLRQMLHDGLIASNGFWGSYSTTPAYPNTSPLYNKSHSAFDFDGDEVSFSVSAIRTIRQGITRNNAATHARQEETSQDVSRMSSSGCPARHVKPSITIKAYTPQLLELSQIFGKTVEELVAPREQSIIDSGVGIIATTLETASDYFAERNKRMTRNAWVMHSSDMRVTF